MADENHRIGSERVGRRARVLAWTAIVALTWLATPGGVLAHGGDAAGTTPSDDSKAAFEDMRGRGVTSGEHPGAALYEVHCARCHSKRVARAPDRSFLEMMPGDRILAALNDGVMRQMAAAMTPEQRAQVAEYLGGSLDAAPEFAPLTCVPGASPFDFDRPPPMAGWGMGLDNRRHVPADVAGLSVDDVAQLELKWAFAVPGANRVRSQPGVAGGGLYFGAPDGTVYALDAKTGCVRWTFRAGAEVRTGVTISPWVAGETPERHPVGYFADLVAWVYAVDLVTGELKWKVKVDEHPTATTTAQPQLVDGVLYQPVSSLEEAAAADPAYECCTFRGSVVALDARTGETIWKRYTIPAPPSPYERDGYPGRTFYGPSGAPVWNTPTIDLEAGRMYVATGDNYSSPADRNSDAVIAFDLPAGERAWTSQATADDAWTVACMGFIDDKGNCPVEKGPDVDFASPPALVDLPGGRYLVAGQKSGVALGMDADTGEILWRRKVGRGGNQGGINFGMAVDGADGQEQDRPLRQVVAAERRGPARLPRHHRGRRIEPHAFVQRGLDQRKVPGPDRGGRAHRERRPRLVGQSPLQVRLARQAVERPGQSVGRGLVPRGEKRQKHVDEVAVVQPLSGLGVVGIHDRLREVVARRAVAAPFDEVEDEAPCVVHGRVHPGLAGPGQRGRQAERRVGDDPRHRVEVVRGRPDQPVDVDLVASGEERAADHLQGHVRHRGAYVDGGGRSGPCLRQRRERLGDRGPIGGERALREGRGGEPSLPAPVRRLGDQEAVAEHRAEQPLVDGRLRKGLVTGDQNALDELRVADERKRPRPDPPDVNRSRIGLRRDRADRIGRDLPEESDGRQGAFRRTDPGRPVRRRHPRGGVVREGCGPVQHGRQVTIRKGSCR